MASLESVEQAQGQPPVDLRPVQRSPFFEYPPTAQHGSLAMLHLTRDALLPIILNESADDGYAEGAVTNTRFGSFPHSTILNVAWGTQIRASKVDTGSRGRKGRKVANNKADGAPDIATHNAVDLPTDGAKKRKPEDSDLEAPPGSPVKRVKQDANHGSSTTFQAAVEAGSGFTHLLPPTPEAWTSSLDHRTQVVYTPDYSYILQRLKVRPGDTIIEAGAGSGSFTHAAARAVFNGYPASRGSTINEKPHKQLGRVCSFEYHEPRVRTLERELEEQHLSSIVHLTHRDVCNEGFALATNPPSSPNANAVFLDLPAPWLALPHLSRSIPNSPLNPLTPIYLCTFSPCIEQVMATTSHLRKNGWTEISMVEVQQRRIDVRRELIGLRHEGLRGVNASPATVAEAITRLRDIETKHSDFHSNKSRGEDDKAKIPNKADRLQEIRKDASMRKTYLEGNLVHRTEPEVKTHTSYLVFAVLPREWSEEDEKACAERWKIAEGVAVKAKGTTNKTQ